MNNPQGRGGGDTALFVRAAFTVIIVRMECGFPFLFSFKPFKIHSTKNPERPWPPRIGPSSISRSIAINKPRVENGIATRCITREKRQGRDLTRVRTYETDACAHSFRSRRFVDRLRILRPDKNGSDRGTRRDRNIWRDSARKNCRISGATTILDGAAIASSLLLTVIRKCFLRSFVLTDECIFSFFSWKRIFLISKDITNFVFS